MASKIKVDELETVSGSGNIVLNNALSGSGASLTSLPAANLTGTLPAISGASLTGVGKVLQVVKTVYTGYGGGTTVTPYDDTIPTSSEGTAFSAIDTAITASNSSNILRITVSGMFGGSTNFWHTIGLFKDSEASASHTIYHYITGSTRSNPVHTVYHQVAGSTSAQTWKIRSGPHTSGTVTIGGDGGNRKYGGSLHSVMQIEEIAV